MFVCRWIVDGLSADGNTYTVLPVGGLSMSVSVDKHVVHFKYSASSYVTQERSDER